ncbi:MAG: hypothetical protein FWH29_09570 [Methanobrevibacter sp.]|nr:hypothetical protein [Methanobrevibacter sp.]
MEKYGDDATFHIKEYVATMKDATRI